jgi:hypothetical protein
MIGEVFLKTKFLAIFGAVIFILSVCVMPSDSSPLLEDERVQEIIEQGREPEPDKPKEPEKPKEPDDPEKSGGNVEINPPEIDKFELVLEEWIGAWMIREEGSVLKTELILNTHRTDGKSLELQVKNVNNYDDNVDFEWYLSDQTTLPLEPLEEIAGLIEFKANNGGAIRKDKITIKADTSIFNLNPGKQKTYIISVIGERKGVKYSSWVYIYVVNY